MSFAERMDGQHEVFACSSVAANLTWPRSSNFRQFFDTVKSVQTKRLAKGDSQQKIRLFWLLSGGYSSSALLLGIPVFLDPASLI